MSKPQNRCYHHWAIVPPTPIPVHLFNRATNQLKHLHTFPFYEKLPTNQHSKPIRVVPNAPTAMSDGFPFADKNKSNQMPPKVQSGQNLRPKKLNPEKSQKRCNPDKIKTHQLFFLKLFDNNLFSVGNLLHKREKINDLYNCIYKRFHRPEWWPQKLLKRCLEYTILKLNFEHFSITFLVLFHVKFTFESTC